jgi:hypothetical protein
MDIQFTRHDMRRSIMALGVFLLGISLAHGDEAKLKPQVSDPPEFAEAYMVDDSELIYIMVRRTETELIEKDGKPATVIRPVWETSAIELDEKRTAAFDRNGRQLKLAALAKRLAKPSVVLIFTGVTKPDPYYLQVLRDDVVIFVVPRPDSEAPVQIVPRDRPKGK